MILRRQWRAAFGLCLALLSWAVAPGAAVAELYPEQGRIEALLSGPRPAGVLFLVMETDTEALTWVVPRVLFYTQQLRTAWGDLPVAVLSHGDEMFGLVSSVAALYPEMHATLRHLVDDLAVSFHVCGAFARLADIDDSDFPPYVDVVPFGPAVIENYRGLEFEVISVEPTW